MGQMIPTTVSGAMKRLKGDEKMKKKRHFVVSVLKYLILRHKKKE